MWMLSWFRRVGSDPYYASYEKSMQRIKSDIENIQASSKKRVQLWTRLKTKFWTGFAALYAAALAYAAWVHRQPPSRFTAGEHSARVVPVLLLPAVSWVAHRLLGWLAELLERRDARHIKALNSKMRKMVAEIKDASHYDRTLELLKKYDPDFEPPRIPHAQPTAATLAHRQPPQGVSAVPAGVTQQVDSGTPAGSGLLPVLGQLWSHAADRLIADDPVMMRLMRQAQGEAEELRLRLGASEAHAARLSRENAALRQQLGLPPEEGGGLDGAAGVEGCVEGGGDATAAVDGGNAGSVQE